MTIWFGVVISAALAAAVPSLFSSGAQMRTEPRQHSLRVANRQPPRSDERAQPRREFGTAVPNCDKTSVGFTPLVDLSSGSYMGSGGGLYQGGENAPPAGHNAAGLALAETIGPLTAGGQPDASGHYVLLSIGFSNTRDEFFGFQEIAASDPAVNNRLVIVNGAQGGVPASRWANPQDPAWATVNSKLSQDGVTPEQVAVVWVKLANRTFYSDPPAPWPAYAEELKADIKSVVRILTDRYPNLRLAYLSSRVYGGYAGPGPGNPEPFAYEGGFSVKWLIQDQIDGASNLNFDPSRGTVEAPWLAWGPYLWADGLVPRSDDLIWECSDFEEDGTHPSETGVSKVASMMLDFFKTDSTARQWFTTTGGPSPAPGGLSTTLQTSRARADYRQSFKVSGQVSAEQECSGPYDLVVKKRVHGSKIAKAIARSVPVADDGSWSITHRSKKNAAYTGVVSAVTCEPGTSPPENVLVRARVIANVPGECRQPQGLQGKVLPKHRGTDVALRRLRGGVWRTVDRDALNRHSRFQLTAPSCSGRYKVVWSTQGKENIKGLRYFRFE